MRCSKSFRRETDLVRIFVFCFLRLRGWRCIRDFVFITARWFRNFFRDGRDVRSRLLLALCAVHLNDRVCDQFVSKVVESIKSGRVDRDVAVLRVKFFQVLENALDLSDVDMEVFFVQL